ncbi:hypothetical protein Q7P37_000919 [Cladosporium fusiforme]
MPRASRRSNGTSKNTLLPKANPISAAISDNESISDGADVPESVPAKAPKAKPKPPVEPESEDEQVDGSDEEAEDEYTVEEILDHKTLRGVIQYKVKWLGYDDEADITWEPAENLETAPEKLQEYHDKIGGPPDLKKKKGDNKRTASEALDSPAPSSTKKRGRKSQTNGTVAAEQSEFTLPKGTWENGISHIMSIVEEEDPEDNSNLIRMGFVQWNTDDGRKTKHPLKTLNTKCPQALLKYYENHLVFSKAEDVPAHLKTEGS